MTFDERVQKRILKLPLWAQEYIKTLQEDIALWKEEVNIWMTIWETEAGENYYD